jgi:predicted transposase YbfD/YdcC
MTERIIEKFMIIEDFRCECDVRHKLQNILILIMCAAMCGLDNSEGRGKAGQLLYRFEGKSGKFAR